MKKRYSAVLVPSLLLSSLVCFEVAKAQMLQPRQNPQEEVDVCFNQDQDNPLVYENKWSVLLNVKDTISKLDILHAIQAMQWMQKPGMTSTFLPASAKLDVPYFSFILDYDPDFKDSQGRQNPSAFKDQILTNLVAVPGVEISCIGIRKAHPAISISN